MAAIQRIRQGLRALFAFTLHVDYELAARYLNDEQMALFRRMQRSERLHSLSVLRDVLAQAEHTPDDLAVAALIHDSGKIRYKLNTAQKTATVLIRAGLPALYKRLCMGEKLTFWAAPFILSRKHPAWSAEYAAQTDTSPRALWLIEHHQDNAGQWRDHEHYELLLRLQEADEAN